MYPEGWDEDAEKYVFPANLPKDKYGEKHFIVPGARNDPQGRHPNDKPGVSFGVVGFIDHPSQLPPRKRGEDPWHEIKV